MGGGAVTALSNSVAGYGGAIYISDKTVLSFNGTNNFIKNSGENDGGAIYALCLASMESTTLAATQPRMVVAVQLWH